MFCKAVNHLLLLGGEAKGGQPFVDCSGGRCRIKKQTHGKADSRFGNKRTLDRFAVQTDSKQTVREKLPVGNSAVVPFMGTEGGFRLGEMTLKNASDELKPFFAVQGSYSGSRSCRSRRLRNCRSVR